MALVGGGGSPNVSGGGNPAGTGTSVNYIGNHAYAYSGRIQINTSNVLHLSFTSGNYLFVGEMTVSAGIKVGDVDDGTTGVFTLAYNGTNLMLLKVESTSSDMPSNTTIPVIIPAYTEVSLTVKSNGTGAGYFTTGSMSGRIYRTRD